MSLKQNLSNTVESLKFLYLSDRRFFFNSHDELYQYETVKSAFILAVIFFFGVFYSPMPADDLLRHVHAWQYHYDYRLMFPDYPYSFNAWYLFDVWTGWLYQTFGEFGIKLVQGLSITIFSFAILLVMKKSHPDWKKFTLILILVFTSTRLLIGRPTLFEGSLMLLAIGITQYKLKPWLDVSLHIAIGLLMVSFYHLFFIYTLPLLLWRRSYIVPMIAGLLGWCLLTHGEYVKEVYEILTFSSMRIEGIQVGENTFVLPTIAFFILATWLFSNSSIKNNWRWWIILIWFALPMQARYLTDIIIPIAIILIARQYDLRPHPLLTILLTGFIIAGFGSNFYSHPKKIDHPYFNENETVFADSLGTNFWVAHHGAQQHVKITPAMEIGFSPKDIQKSNLDKTVTCNLLNKYHITTLVERSMVKLPLECLKLKQSTQEGYKIWKVVKKPPHKSSTGKHYR